MTTQRKHLTDEEYLPIKRALEKSEKIEHRIIYLLLLTGARLREVLNLRARAFDLSAKQLHLKSLKGSKDRSIHLTFATLCSYAPHFKVMDSRKCSFGALMVSDTCAKPRSQVRRIQRAWRALCEEVLGYFPVSIHGLRHTFTMRVLKKSDNNLKLAQTQLGHRYLTTTQRYLDYKEGLDCREIMLKVNED